MTGQERILETLTGALSGAEGDQAELVMIRGRQNLSRCANSVVHQNVSSDDALIVGRVINDRRVGLASTHGGDAAAAARALRDAAELARYTPRNEDFRGLPGPGTTAAVESHVPETAAVGPEERARCIGTVFDAAKAHGLTVAGSYATLDQEMAVVNTEGVSVYAPLTCGAANFVVMGRASSGYASAYSRDVRDLDFAGMAETAVRKCLAGGKVVDLEPGEYEVILEPAAVAELMEWMAYTCFSARSVHEKTSALAGRFGEPLMGDNITIYDHATEAGGVVTPFDFEGQPKRRLDLVRGGVPVGFGTDSLWASRMRCENTAHALLATGEGVDPVPMSLFLEPGDTDAAAMPERVERGLLVTRLHYVNGFLDTRRALMTGMTRDGTFLVEDGKVKGAVGNLRFTQSMVDAFNDVRALSRERQAIPPWWSAATNTGALTMPTVHLGRFNFTGRQEKT